MAKYDIRPLQMCMLRILMAIDKCCKEHQLQYGIDGGSLIGAVRHKGFIPWDDDLDIIMPRPDYEKFIQHSKEWLPAPYEFKCAENDPLYPLPFGKVQDSSTTLIERPHLYYLGGVYVDIFPLDVVPSNWLAQHIQIWKYSFLRQALYWIHRDPYRHGHGPSSWIFLLTRKVTTMQKLQRRIRRILLKYDYAKGKLAESYTDGFKRIMPKSIMETYAPYEFEGQKVMGIKDYDYYLKQGYGDYMQVPPPEKRIQHNFYYLDLDHSYHDYKGQDKK